MRRPLARARIGLALEPGRLAAVLPGGGVLEADAADLGRALADLRERSGLGRATVGAALLPPIAAVRTLTLPPLKEEERQRVLERDARRYFVDLAEPVVVGSHAMGTQVVAAAAPEEILADLEAAVASVGWSLRSVVPAHAAWAAYARRRTPARHAGHVVVRLRDATEVLGVAGGRILEHRRFRALPEAEARVATVTAPSAAADRVSVLGSPDADPAVIAALHAPAALGPELLTAGRRAQRAATARRVVQGLWVAAAACVVLSAGLDYLGLAQSLSRVRAQRAGLAQQVALAMTARDSLRELSEGLATLGRLRATSPRWSSFLADLADFVPTHAQIVGVRAVGDSAVLEGVAAQSAEVFEALQQMPGVAGVRAAGAIQRDVQPDGSVREHFALNAWLGGGAERSSP